MRITLCLNATGLTEEALLPLAGGATAFARSLERLTCFEAPEGQVRVPISVVADPGTASLPTDPAVSVVYPRDASLPAFLETLDAISNDSDALLLAPADGPFWDPALGRRLLEVHRQYVAEYTFADGFPEGLAPEVVSRDILPALVELARRYQDVTERHTLFDIVQKDINAFDVETELSAEDMRMLRIRLRCDTRRNRLLCDQLAREFDHKHRDADGVVRHLRDHQRYLRTLPAFLTVQVTTAVSQKPFYLPEPFPFEGENREMSPGDFESLARGFCRFAPDSVIHLSTWGEIACHGDVSTLLELTNRIDCRRFWVETSGVGWKPEVVEAIVSGRYPKVTWIVCLDAYSEEVYRRVRGEGFAEAVGFASALLDKLPGSVYLQSTRMEENEEDLESFYREWKKVTPNVIIQKYDHFSQRLPDRRVVDNAPVVRLPCWHLKRDMSVLVDGSVPLCREDLSLDHRLGNALTEPMEAVWLRGETYYQRHVDGDYPALCQKCDEYYTFNF
ncbi:MAG: spiro-SPASM protein [Spirochaetota bacterium]